ncbi:Alpha,alpha-trehalose-phosphate synthase [Schizosaccharomyces pombe]|uniref:Putative alpha,alpha-trehalose-phosphate synthase [UDP-forming] 106 kDa subunit n=1 Tax=Schizosaccharomyces pombe (strain 972 / ATCC 24843) TaxID=284812 RepID=TPSX_SCHPO|nr:putative alpha,alpha-trehalose-phosphate synthase [Schizosaccharomyces pombe]O14081.1 RecName: Full=Putative alpha,alpha-trehalose-phosphate synthase [UDP-forming] 106 kDa subunit; AltName: Full=Trehalose-6-phosphate synthase; AltName: Full=UDP-glucose-glucosephosphate glucosyltransferase [Schizosaccharomyces pombe 972h-]CAA20146.1 alpha,alpha-trehalose-phosphate synthase (predicted) [Schizosaccharomyces pombe]|eukprot:NP_593962.1 putative alpha,alpha-trehalose-phosphate synthase [Schizosaccharomyces pombe]
MGRILIAHLFLPSSVGFSFDTVPHDEVGSKFMQKEESKDWIADTPLDESAIVSEEESDDDSLLSDLPEEIDSTNAQSNIATPSPGTVAAAISGIQPPPKTPSSDSPSLENSLSNLNDLFKSRGRHMAFSKNDGTNLSLPPSRHQSPPPSSVLASQRHHRRHDSELEEFARRASRSLSFSMNGTPQRRMTFDAEAWKNVIFKIKPSSFGNASFYNAISAATRSKQFDDHLFVGTCGIPTDSLPDSLKERISHDYITEHSSLVVYPTDTDFVGHYNHYCKNILWPTFHYQIPDNPKSKAYEDHSWANYVKVNKAFADTIVDNYEQDDMIWINDYHLLLVPEMVRERLPRAKIGFFLHIPFPSSEVFRCLATRQEILKGMLGANILGFQIPEFAYHFLQTCSRLVNIDIRKNGVVSFENRQIDVIALPISIDPGFIDRCLASPPVEHWAKVLQDRFRGKHIILSHDKLDPIRGLRSKLISFERFLQKYPEYRENTILLQVAPESLQDSEHLPHISDIVTRINSAYSNIASRHVPVILLRQKLGYAQFLALMMISDALIDNSLREGISLTSHQFIYVQRKRHRPLILSEFVGSASILNDNAIIVNPWDYSKTAEAFRTALTMSEEECQKRNKAMCNLILRHDAASWAVTFQSLIKESWKEQIDMQRIPAFTAQLIKEPYQNAQKRLILLYFEGTISTWGSQYHNVMTSLQRTINLLNMLTSDPKNTVYVFSALSCQELEQLFQRVPKLGIVAENGCFVRSPPKGDATMPVSKKEIAELWKNKVLGTDLTWMKTVSEIFEYYAERTTGAYVENKDATVILHLREAEDDEAAMWAAKECCESVNNFNVPCSATIQNDMVVCRSNKVSKRLAAEDIYSANGGDYDFIFAASNDPDDDTVFSWMKNFKQSKKEVVPFTFSVCVSEHGNSTNADAESSGVFGFLQALEKVYSA